MKTVRDALPPEILEGATQRGHEYGWKLAAFPDVLRKAEALGYACVGGQFQACWSDGSVCEMYWLNADSRERAAGESWSDYSRRSCQEVSRGFQRLMARTDFAKEVASWRGDLKAELARGLDATSILMFVAYFISEAEADRLSAKPEPKPLTRIDL
jgi:hypothetical protein